MRPVYVIFDATKACGNPSISQLLAMKDAIFPFSVCSPISRCLP
jgi:hypothetical protein